MELNWMGKILAESATSIAWMFGSRAVRPIDLLQACADSARPSGYVLARHGVSEEALISLRRSLSSVEAVPVLDLYRGSLSDETLAFFMADRPPTVWRPTHDAQVALDVVLCSDEAVQMTLSKLVRDKPSLVADMYRAVDAPRDKANVLRKTRPHTSVYRRRGRVYLVAGPYAPGVTGPPQRDPVVLDQVPPLDEFGQIVVDALTPVNVENFPRQPANAGPIHERLGFKTAVTFMNGTRCVGLDLHDATITFHPWQREGTRGFSGLNVNHLRAPIDRLAVIGATLVRAIDVSTG